MNQIRTTDQIRATSPNLRATDQSKDYTWNTQKIRTNYQIECISYMRARCDRPSTTNGLGETAIETACDLVAKRCAPRLITYYRRERCATDEFGAAD